MRVNFKARDKAQRWNECPGLNPGTSKRKEGETETEQPGEQQVSENASSLILFVSQSINITNYMVTLMCLFN